MYGTALGAIVASRVVDAASQKQMRAAPHAASPGRRCAFVRPSDPSSARRDFLLPALIGPAPEGGRRLAGPAESLKSYAAELARRNARARFVVDLQARPSRRPGRRASSRSPRSYFLPNIARPMGCASSTLTKTRISPDGDAGRARVARDSVASVGSAGEARRGQRAFREQTRSTTTTTSTVDDDFETRRAHIDRDAKAARTATAAAVAEARVAAPPICGRAGSGDDRTMMRRPNRNRPSVEVDEAAGFGFRRVLSYTGPHTTPSAW